jgi:hypothetical protein
VELEDLRAEAPIDRDGARGRVAVGAARLKFAF